MNTLDLDSGLASVVDCVREVNGPISQALTDDKPVTETDYAALSGAVYALLDAIDARVNPAQPEKAVAA